MPEGQLVCRLTDRHVTATDAEEKLQEFIEQLHREYLREALPGLFAPGEKPATEQLVDWLPDRWLLNRARNTSIAPATAG